MRHLLALITLCAAIGSSAHAADPDEVSQLYGALRVPEMVALMAQEGLNYGEDLEEAMFPDAGGAAWDRLVQQIYDPAKMEQTVRAQFQIAFSDDRIAPAELEDMLAFYASDLGQRIVALELSAREAILNPEIDAIAHEAASEAASEETPRFAQIQQFISVNDLIERNVAGSLNSNMAFFTGLSATGGDLYEMSESDILTEVWQSENEVRNDSRNWLEAYLHMAYQPLSDAELESYTSFSDTRPGRRLLDASFEAYNTMFNAISAQLGEAAGQFATSEQL